MHNEKSFNHWTRKEFEALPLREWDEDIGEFDSLIILPTRHIHDSGYRCLDFVAIRDGKPLIRLSGCSDVIHLDGFGGLGYWDNIVPKTIGCKAWSIDCLKTSGLLRIFSHGKLTIGAALSSFEIFST